MGKHLWFYLNSSDFLDLFPSGLRPGLSTNTYSGSLVRLLTETKLTFLADRLKAGCDTTFIQLCECFRLWRVLTPSPHLEQYSELLERVKQLAFFLCAFCSLRGYWANFI